MSGDNPEEGLWCVCPYMSPLPPPQTSAQDHQPNGMQHSAVWSPHPRSSPYLLGLDGGSPGGPFFPFLPPGSTASLQSPYSGKSLLVLEQVVSPLL